MKELLENWSVLNKGLHKLNEEDLIKLLQAEKKGKRRVQFMIRIYGRFNRLRTERERSELLGG